MSLIPCQPGYGSCNEAINIRSKNSIICNLTGHFFSGSGVGVGVAGASGGMHVVMVLPSLTVVVSTGAPCILLSLQVQYANSVVVTAVFLLMSN